MSVLIIAEHDNTELLSATLNVVTAARRLEGDVHVLVAGSQAEAVAQSAAKIAGVAKVLLVDTPCYAAALPEPLAALVVGLAQDYHAILAPATSFGKSVLPRVAALLDVTQFSDVVSITSPDIFVRPIYAGNFLVTLRGDDRIKVATVRCTAFEPAPEGGNAVIERLPAVKAPGLSSLVSRQSSKSERPDLTSAKIVISGGRGMGSAENFGLLEAIADKIGAAVGASRAAVDAGFVPNDLQVGQTGKIVAPQLYIAVGISGAIQHLAGMKDSKVIVAINKDEEAPIFQVADYGLVADLFQALPELLSELSM